MEQFNINWMVVLFVGGVGFAAILGMFTMSFMMAPKRKSAIKETPYECGRRPTLYRTRHI